MILLARSIRYGVCTVFCRKCMILRRFSGNSNKSWQTDLARRLAAFPEKLSAKRIVSLFPAKYRPYLNLIRADKPIGTWLLFWPCAWSITLASAPGHAPNFYLLALFGAGAFFMRGAGCVINDLWDRDFDRKVERTRSRPLASGAVTPRQAFVFLGGLLSLSFAILMQLNWLSVFVGVSSIILVVSYPLAKRYTYWPQVVLGLTFNWGALLGWAAATGDISLAPLLLYLAGINWTLVYDTIYAHQDKTDDLMVGVKSTALRFGDQTKRWLNGFAFGMISCLGLAGLLAGESLPFYFGCGLVAFDLFRLIRRVDLNSPADCWKTFAANKHTGLLIFLCLLLGKV